MLLGRHRSPNRLKTFTQHCNWGEAGGGGGGGGEYSQEKIVVHEYGFVKMRKNASNTKSIIIFAPNCSDPTYYNGKTDKHKPRN